MKQSCRTCIYLELRGKRISKHKVYPCKAPIPPMPDAMPDSIRKAFGFWWPGDNNKTYVQPDDGTTCGAWKKATT